METLEELLERITKTNSCWFWNGAKNSRGYGQVQFNGKRTYVHRLVYAFVFGEIPKNSFILHKCDTPLCCNPEHLWAGTQKENMIDAREKGRIRNQYS